MEEWARAIASKGVALLRQCSSFKSTEWDHYIRLGIPGYHFTVEDQVSNTRIEGVEAIFSNALINCEVGGINAFPLVSADIGLK